MSTIEAKHFAALQFLPGVHLFSVKPKSGRISVFIVHGSTTKRFGTAVLADQKHGTVELRTVCGLDDAMMLHFVYLSFYLLCIC